MAPTAQRSEGLGTNEWSGGVALAATKTITGPLSAFASAGYQYNGRGGANVEDQFVSGLGVEYVVTPHVSLLAEGRPTPTGGPTRTGTPTGSPG